MWLNISTFRISISQSKEANEKRRKMKNEKLRSERFGSIRTRSWHALFQHFAAAAQLDK